MPGNETSLAVCVCAFVVSSPSQETHMIVVMSFPFSNGLEQPRKYSIHSTLCLYLSGQILICSLHYCKSLRIKGLMD